MAKKEKKVSVWDISFRMLTEGKYTRKEIMDEIRKQRPDFKDPSACVSNQMSRMRKADKPFTLKDAGVRKARKPKATGNGEETGPRIPLEEQRRRVLAWKERTTVEVAAGFKRVKDRQAKNEA